MVFTLMFILHISSEWFNRDRYYCNLARNNNYIFQPSNLYNLYTHLSPLSPHTHTHTFSLSLFPFVIVLFLSVSIFIIYLVLYGITSTQWSARISRNRTEKGTWKTNAKWCIIVCWWQWWWCWTSIIRLEISFFNLYNNCK